MGCIVYGDWSFTKNLKVDKPNELTKKDFPREEYTGLMVDPILATIGLSIRKKNEY